MDKERLWKRFQAHMGYTDAEMEIFRSDPLKVKMVTEIPEFVKSRIIAEVIESHGCHAGHKVGQKFVMDGNGHSDPKNERTTVVQCHDVGLDKGGWGKILMKVYVEPARSGGPGAGEALNE